MFFSVPPQLIICRLLGQYCLSQKNLLALAYCEYMYFILLQYAGKSLLQCCQGFCKHVIFAVLIP